jgi:hypothetical protein
VKWTFGVEGFLPLRNTHMLCAVLLFYFRYVV